jgi:hypothetical protein
MKRLLVAAAANYVAPHGRRTQLAFAAATSTHSRHQAEPVDPPPVRITAASALTRYWAIAVSHRWPRHRRERTSTA